MSGQLMRCDRVLVAVRFHEHEMRRVVSVLQEIEADYAGLFPAVAGVLDSGLAECVDMLALDVNIHEENQHELHYADCRVVSVKDYLPGPRGSVLDRAPWLAPRGLRTIAR